MYSVHQFTSLVHTKVSTSHRAGTLTASLLTKRLQVQILRRAAFGHNPTMVAALEDFREPSGQGASGVHNGSDGFGSSQNTTVLAGPGNLASMPKTSMRESEQLNNNRSDPSLLAARSGTAQTAAVLESGDIIQHHTAHSTLQGASEHSAHAPLATVDAADVITRFNSYVAQYNVPGQLAESMRQLLDGPTGRGVLSLHVNQLRSVLINDIYKPSMHRMYAKYLRGVQADFALNVRRTPCSLAHIRAQQPALYAAFLRDVQALADVQPYSAAVQSALTCFGALPPTEEMLSRAAAHGVAPVVWQDMADGAPLAFASGPVESASHVETTLMQMVQGLVIAAQALHTGPEGKQAAAPAAPPPAAAGMGTAWPDRAERLAGSLAKLCLTLQGLNALQHGMQVALFAGRRASDPAYLLLQNAFFARHAQGYVGTSSVYAATLLHQVWDAQGMSQAEQAAWLGSLVGTHAHEQTCIIQQLLGSYDEAAGRASGQSTPILITPLLAHLLFMSASRGVHNATALADTFTTRAFVAVALAVDVPQEWREDVQLRYGWSLPQHAKCFDLFRQWRMDSGEYAEMAGIVMDAWAQRCASCTAAGQEPPAWPHLMHSNLSSLGDIAEVSALPERIRPSMLAFGTMADGFLPFPPSPHAHVTPAAQSGAASTSNASKPGSKATHEIKMASLVMKAVQARAERLGVPQQACAVKLGDDVDGVVHGQVLGALPAGGKIQVDPRVSPELAHETVASLAAQARASAGVTAAEHGLALSKVLADAYHAVTRLNVLN